MCINYMVRIRKGISKGSFNILWKFKGERISLARMECGNSIWDLVKK